MYYNMGLGELQQIATTIFKEFLDVSHLQQSRF